MLSCPLCDTAADPADAARGAACPQCPQTWCAACQTRLIDAARVAELDAVRCPFCRAHVQAVQVIHDINDWLQGWF